MYGKSTAGSDKAQRLVAANKIHEVSFVLHDSICADDWKQGPTVFICNTIMHRFAWRTLEWLAELRVSINRTES